MPSPLLQQAAKRRIQQVSGETQMAPVGRTRQAQKFYRGELGQQPKQGLRKGIAETYVNVGAPQPAGRPVEQTSQQQGGMSPSTIIQLLAQHGFQGQDLPLMAATIFRESGGRPGAINDQGEYSQGLGQINTGPGSNTQYSGRNLLDPNVNIQTVKEMFDKSGYFPWYGYSKNLPPRIEAMKNYLPEMIRTATDMGLYQHQGPISFNPGGRYGALIVSQ